MTLTTKKEVRMLGWALHSGLNNNIFCTYRDDVSDVFKTTDLARMKTTEKKQLLIYQQCIEDHFAG